MEIVVEVHHFSVVSGIRLPFREVYTNGFPASVPIGIAVFDEIAPVITQLVAQIPVPTGIRSVRTRHRLENIMMLG